jgi:hypothetical protein
VRLGFGGSRSIEPRFGGPATCGRARCRRAALREGDGKIVVLAHVRVIDGTGAAELADRTIVIQDGKIVSVGSSADALPPDATVLDLSGRTLIPGLVGMHDHMYYIARPNLDAAAHSEPPLLSPQMTAARVLAWAALQIDGGPPG